MAFKYIVADPGENCGLIHDFGEGDIAIRLICYAPEMKLLQLDVQADGVWHAASDAQVEIFKTCYSNSQGEFTLDPLELDIDRNFVLPEWCGQSVLDFDADHASRVEAVIDDVGEDIDAIESFLTHIWGTTSQDERRELIYTPEGVQNIGLGGLSKLGLFDDSEYRPWDLDWEDLELDHDSLVIWLESAEQHVADTGEPEHVIGDLHDLIRGIGLTVTPDKLEAGLASWRTDLETGPKL